MFDSAITSFKDEILDYKKYPVITADRCVIEEHTLEIDIKDWCTNLVSAFRVALMILRPTARMETSEQKLTTRDLKILGSRVVLSLGIIKLDSTVECNRFRLFRKDPAKAAEDGSTFKYFDTYDIEFFNGDKKIDKQVVNRQEIAGLEIGQSIEITGEVNRYDVLTGGIRHIGITRFERYLDEPVVSKDGSKRVSGKLRIFYEDNISGKTIAKTALKQLLDIITEALRRDGKTNYDSNLIEIEGDRSGCFCRLIDHYLVANSKEVIQTSVELVEYKAVMNFRDVEEEVLNNAIAATLKAITADINSLIKQLDSMK